MRYILIMKAKNNELLIFDEPTNYIEAIPSIKWLNTMKYEIDYMYTKHVWTLINPSKE